MATVFTDSPEHPSFADVTGDFVYVRTMRADKSQRDGIAPQAALQLAACARRWRDGGEPAALPRIEPATEAPAAPREVFLFFISADKEKAPAAAMALIDRLGGG